MSLLFVCLMVLALLQCAKRGNPTGGPKDVKPPELIGAEPPDLTTEFKAKKIRLYFDEYIKLEDIQNQLIVSPPLKYAPQISPQGGASKVVEIILKDTLRENTTYTINFGQSILDNNEGNPNSFLSYVFSTGTYIDSLTVAGVVKDAFNKETDDFLTVMLYEIDTAFTDSTIYKSLPNYITNTQDSTNIFRLQHLKPGQYAMVAMKDEAKNNVFDQKTDKIGFIQDTVTLPTDTVFLLKLFREIPNYSVLPPGFAAANRIMFGYTGKNIQPSIELLTPIPDSIRTLIAKEPLKDTLNFWFTPFKMDSLVFKIYNETQVQNDTFSVKSRKLEADSLVLNPSHRGTLNFEEDFYLSATIPIIKLDTSRISLLNSDSLPMPVNLRLDSLENRLLFDFEKGANENYTIEMLPGALVDFFEDTNDTLSIRLGTSSYADLGNLRLNLGGAIRFPVIVQLTDEKGKMVREVYATEQRIIEFNNIDPAKYWVRVLFDDNKNGKWDTGNYLKKIQPEEVIYFLKLLEVRANWELEENFSVGG